MGEAESVLTAMTACSSGLEPASRPKLNFLPWLMTSSTTGRIWLTLMG